MDSSVEQTSSGKKAPAIRDLYPTLSNRELKEAEANLRRYLEIALDIRNEQCSHPNMSVDNTSASPTMKERSNISLKI